MIKVNIWNTQLISGREISPNIADSSWVITLSPPDLCFYPTGGRLNHVSVQIHGVFRSKQLSNFQTSFKGVFTQINSCLFQ